jgi:hypothetical protein
MAKLEPESRLIVREKVSDLREGEEAYINPRSLAQTLSGELFVNRSAKLTSRYWNAAKIRRQGKGFHVTLGEDNKVNVRINRLNALVSYMPTLSITYDAGSHRG